MSPKQKSKRIRRRWRATIYARDGYECRYCGKVFPEDQLSIDHFWPAFLGGSDDPANFVTACRECGKLKSHLPPLFFRKHHEELAEAYEQERKLFGGLIRGEQAKGGTE